MLQSEGLKLRGKRTAQIRESGPKNQEVFLDLLKLQFHFLTRTGSGRERSQEWVDGEEGHPRSTVSGRGSQGETGRVLGLHLLAVHLYVCDVVLKDGGDVDLRELILAEHDEQTGLPTGPIAHNHQLLSDRSHGSG